LDYKTGPDYTGNLHYSVCVKKCPKNGTAVDWMDNSRYKAKSSAKKDIDNRKELEKWE
jgi:hypothetical protein